MIWKEQSRWLNESIAINEWNPERRWHRERRESNQSSKISQKQVKSKGNHSWIRFKGRHRHLGIPETFKKGRRDKGNLGRRGVAGVWPAMKKAIGYKTAHIWLSFWKRYVMKRKHQKTRLPGLWSHSHGWPDCWWREKCKKRKIRRMRGMLYWAK